MVTLIEAVILAVIQGLAEWLPVSSSGHLVIAQHFLGLNPPLIFDVMLHFGTLIVVLVMFRNDVLDILKALVKGNFNSEEGKLALHLIIGSIPIAIIGVTFYGFIKSLFSNLLAAGLALLVTGCVLFISEKRSGAKKMNSLDSLLVGLAQGIAIIPGISRSGLTISTGLLRKIDKSTAFRYSFLLSVPAILGATIIEVKDLVVGNVDLFPIVVGVIVSMLVGYASLTLLQKIVMNERFHLFAYYCWGVGIAIVAFTLIW
jgi:undecaprenyl-diphosphatase